jgi:hypothetical protein
MHYLNLRHAATVLSFALGFHATMAQPGDVDRIDIRLMEAGPDLLEVQLRPNAPWDLSDGVLNLTFAIRWQSAQGGTINSDLIDQFFQGGPPFCMFIGAPLSGTSGGGIDNIDNAGSRYKGLNATGNQLPGSCTFAANTWVPYARIPVDGITGCATFEIVVTDPFAAANNSNWFISLGGTNITAQSQVVGPGVSLGACLVDCNGIQGGTALPGTSCDPGDLCIQNAVYDVDCNCVGSPVLAPVIDNISSNSPICTGSQLVLGVDAIGVGVLTYTWSGTGSFSPDQGSQDVTVTGATSGEYTVTVSNGCGLAEATVQVVVNTPSLATIAYSGGPYCNTGTISVTRTGTSGGVFSAAPVGLNLDANTGAVDLAASSPGNYTVTYTIGASGGCPAFSTTAGIIVNAVPTLTTGSYGPLCSDGASVTLTGAPAGGTWSGTGVTGNQFNPTAGTQTINYSVTQNGCTGSASTTITVNTTPTVTTGNYGPLCSGDAVITLTGTPAGGTWSGTGVTGNQFDPSAGTQTISYSVTQNGCTGNASTTITVNTAPTVTTGSYGPLCSGDAAIALTGTPAGGTWSGTGVTGNQFDPAAGTQTISYSVTQNGCTGSASTTITVNAAPTVSTGSYGPLCSGDASITLTGAPAGGTWSGTGVTGNQFDPAAGTQTLSYSVTQNGCTGNASTTITVNAAPTVTTGSYGPLCSGDAVINLVGTPAGGTWSGTGVTGNQFNPAAGTQTVNYLVTQNGCTGSASTTIMVNAAPTVTTGSYGPLCSGDASITLTGTPAGGTWSGTGVTGDQFDPTAGTQTINYSVTQNGCTGNANTTITVNAAATVTTGSYGPLCSGDASITLTGAPAGGTWSGTGVTGNQFDPAAGTQTINYSVTQNGCTGNASTTITVSPSPTVITGSYGPLCSGDAAITLTGAPAGGTWSGLGITGNQFDPAAGTQTINYSVTQNGCTGSASTTITVNAAPTVITGSYGPLCSGGAAITLTGAPAGGTWSGIGITGNQFDPAAGTQTINYSVTQNGCTGNVSTTITVNTVPTVTTGSYGPLCSDGAWITLTGAPAGGTWSGTGVTGNQFGPAAGTQTINYSVTQNGCTVNASTTITVNTAPTVTTGSYGPLCSGDASITLTGTPAGGTWSGTGVTGNQFVPAAGTQTISYSVTQNGCTSNASATITVNAAPTVTTGSYGPLCSGDALLELIGSPVGGVWSGTGVSGNSFDPSAGTQTLTYSLTQSGCTGSASTTITVTPSPTAEFTVGTTDLFVNEPIDFVNASSGGNYTWDFGDGGTSEEENPSHTYTALGTYTVTLTVEEGGCSSTFSLDIVVDMSTGIRNIANRDVRVWAAYDQIVLEHTITQSTPLRIELMDAGGRVHMNVQVPGVPDRVHLPSSTLSSGIWFLVLRSEQATDIYRVPVLR